MNNLEKCLAKFSNSKNKRKVEYATHLYDKLLTPENADLLDGFSETLVEVVSGSKVNVNNSKFTNNILEEFYYYLIKNGKKGNTPYDYASRIKAICTEYKIDIGDLYGRKSGYSIDDLIGMYSKGGIKSDENTKRHNAPLSALKWFKRFMDEKTIDVNDTFFDNQFFHDESKGIRYQASNSTNMTQYRIEIQKVPNEHFGTIKLYDSANTAIATDFIISNPSNKEMLKDDILIKCLNMLIKADPNEQARKIIGILQNEFNVSMIIDGRKVI